MTQRLRKLVSQLTPKNDNNMRYYGVFSVGEPPSDELIHEYGDYGDFMIRMFYQNNTNERFIKYKINDNTFPTNKELSQLSCIIITGSKCDSFCKNTEWIIKLKELIYNIMTNDKYKHIKLIGICFGHQIIAEALYGKVIRNHIVDWEIGIRNIILTEQFYEMFPNIDADKCKSLNVIEHHRDIVYKLPKNAVLLGSSMNTRNEIYSIGNRILCIQGHPEFNVVYEKKLIELYHKKLGFKCVFNAAKSFGKYNEPDTDIWHEILNEWIRR